MSSPRRFIAGAVCPRCGELDRIVMFEDEGVQHRECVACDFSERTETEAPADAAALPSGRLDAPRPKPQTTAQPIRFYPRPPASGSASDASDD